MKHKKRVARIISLMLSFLLLISCIEPASVMATQMDANVESVLEDAVPQAEEDNETKEEVESTSSIPAEEKEEETAAPEETLTEEPTEIPKDVEISTDAETPEDAEVSTEVETPEENPEQITESEPIPEETANILSFENAEDKLAVELKKDRDFIQGLRADIRLLRDEERDVAADSLKESLENNGYVVNMDTILPVEINVLDEENGKKDAGEVSVKVFTDVSNLKDSVLYHQKEDGTWKELPFEISDDSSYVSFDVEKLGNFLFVKTSLVKKDVLETNFSFEDETVTITAKATEEAGLKEGTKLCAVALREDSEEYQDAVKKVEESVGLKEGQVLHFKPYDVYFEYQGERIEPKKGLVKISMSFKEDIFKDVTESTPIEQSFVAHIKENGEVEQLEDTSGKKRKVAFDVESFSVMGPALLAADEGISALADTDAYAILYENGEMVFQRGDTPDASKGNVIGTYTGFETKQYLNNTQIPWSGYKSSIKRVSFKDTIKPISTRSWFYNCNNLTDIDLIKLDTSAVTNMNSMFYGCSSLTSLDVSSFDTSAVTDMGSVFYNCSSLTSLDVSSFDTLAVTSMSSMFYGCRSLTSLDVSSFDTSAVRSMMKMFYGCRSLTSLDVSSFDTSAVTNMSQMFMSCSSLTSLDVSSFDTSAVTNMGNMFIDCNALTSLDVSSFDTSAVTNMYNMFSGCSALTSLDVSSFDTSAVTDMSQMFMSCSSLTSLDVSSFDTSAVTNTGYMFYDCSSLTSLDLSSFDTSAVTEMSNMFKDCSSLVSLDVSSFDTSAVKYMISMFYGCSSLTSLDVSSFDTSAVTNTGYMFYGCGSLTSLDLSSFDTSAVTGMNYMFERCISLTSLDLRSFDTSAVTSMISMFASCSSLTSLDLSSFDTSAVTRMDGIFSNCSSLTSLDLSSFDTSAVTRMDRIFSNCSSLTSLDLSSFDTSAVTKMNNMFSYCGKLTSLDVSSFDTSAVTDMNSMFYRCEALTSLDLSSFDTSAVTSMEYMFDYCRALKRLVLGKSFSFKDKTLPSAMWHGMKQNKDYTSDVLQSNYDGATMADTYVKWIDIKFNAAGGEASESTREGYIGISFDTLPSAEKTGNAFLGWFTEEEGGVELKVGEPTTQDTYYAHYQEYPDNQITVNNTVKGTMGNKAKDFTFQIKFTGDVPAEIPFTKGEETGVMTVKDGVSEFTLAHGENIVLGEIPNGTTYDITELDGITNGYTVESTNSSGTLTEDTTVTFTNTRNGTVPTAAHTNILLYMGVLTLALIGLFWYLRKRKQ